MSNIKQLYDDKEHTTKAYPKVWFPVGTLYWNENDISSDIDKYFEGTWERVKDVFILAAGDKYNAKSSGGEAEHILTVDEMPEHSHSNLTIDVTKLAWSNQFSIGSNKSGLGTDGNVDDHNIYTDMKGSSQPHNNMPPYYTAYCWKRIS